MILELGLKEQEALAMERRRAVQGQVCGRCGRGKSKVGLQKWMGIATHSLASLAERVGFHLRSNNRIHRGMHPGEGSPRRGCLALTFSQRSRTRKRGFLGAVHPSVAPLSPQTEGASELCLPPHTHIIHP